jgi:hypothetical protein
MVGLVQFLPTALLVFVAGHAADRFERKRVVQVCQLAEAATALFLCWGSYAGWLTEVHIFIATFVLGIAGAFESPATAALLPLIAPQGTLTKAASEPEKAARAPSRSGAKPKCIKAAEAFALHLAPPQPRPTNGIFDAITVMVSTLASSGRPAI